MVFAIAGAAIGFAWFRKLNAGPFRTVLHLLLIVSGIGLFLAARLAGAGAPH